MNPGIKKTAQSLKLLFALFQVLSVKLVKKGFVVSAEEICVKWDRLMWDIIERLSGLNHNEDVFFKRTVEILVIEMDDAKSPCHWSIPTELHEKKRSTLLYLIIILTSIIQRKRMEVALEFAAKTFEDVMYSKMSVTRTLKKLTPWSFSTARHSSEASA